MPFYPAVPSYRMAYDRDGSVVTHIDPSNVVHTLSGPQKQALNDEDDDGYAWTVYVTNKLAFIFPELRDVTGYFVSAAPLSGPGLNGEGLLESSTDTTNGLDGTWTTVISSWAVSGLILPYYRSAIQTISTSGIIGLRFTGSIGGDGATFKAMHLYGTIHTGAVRYLAMWHPTLDQELSATAGDEGDVPQGTTADISFRVKNLHSSLTAVAPAISIEAPTDASPSVPPQYTFGTGGGGGSFSSGVTLANIAAGAISAETVTMRRSTDPAAALSLWTARVVAAAASWS